MSIFFIFTLKFRLKGSLELNGSWARAGIGISKLKRTVSTVLPENRPLTVDATTSTFIFWNRLEIGMKKVWSILYVNSFWVERPFYFSFFFINSSRSSSRPIILRDCITKGSQIIRMKNVFEQAKFSSLWIVNLTLPNDCRCLVEELPTFFGLQWQINKF